jgi:hypothetical protein
MFKNFVKVRKGKIAEYYNLQELIRISQEQIQVS